MSTKVLGIDIGSFQVTAVIAQQQNDELCITGVSNQKSQGIKKGVITNIELASSSIKSAILDAQKEAGGTTDFDQVVVSISGAYTKSIESVGFISLPKHEINIAEIERVMKRAEEAANIPNDHEKIHILPYSFKVDSQENIEDPHGMMGDRLEVFTHTIIAQKSTISNIKKAVKKAGLSIDNLVLSSYASAISTLTKDEKDLGVVLIDMGGETCNIAIHAGNSIRYNDFLAVGSNNITKDLSEQLHTPLLDAENIKITLGSKSKHTSSTIDIPTIAGDGNKQISIDLITDLIYSRVDETIMLLANMLEESKYENLAGAGIVLTGGMTKLEGIRRITSAIFDRKPVRIAKPTILSERVNDPIYSCAVGLCMYGAGGFTQYEMDSENKMRYKGEPKRISNTFNIQTDNFDSITKEQTQNTNIDLILNTEKDSLINIAEIDNAEKDTGTFNWIKNIWHKITQLF